MVTKKMLTDNYKATGRDMTGFTRNVKNFSDATEVLSVRGSEITLLSLCTIPRYQLEGKTVFYILSKENVESFIDFGERLKLGSLDNEEIGDDLLEELKNGTKMMFTYDGEKYIMAKSAVVTLSQRVGVGGDTTVNRNNLVRDLHMADALFSKDEPVNFVYRYTDNINKVFASFSGDFILNKQDHVLKVMSDIRFPFHEYAVRRYHVNNYISEIECDLPSRYEGIIPGFMIKNSDTGNSSFIVRSTCHIGNSYAILSESILRHDKNFTYERLINETFAQARKSFDKLVPVFEKKLEHLKNSWITDYSSFDPLSDLSRNKNFSAAKNLLKEGIGIFKGNLSKKAQVSVLDALLDELDAGKKYSAYDIAAMLMHVPEYLSYLDESTLTNLRKNACYVPAFVEERVSADYQ